MTEIPQNGSATAPSGQHSGPTVLVVEDEDSLRGVLTDLRMPIVDSRQLAAARARLLANPLRTDDLLALVRGQLERRV